MMEFNLKLAEPCPEYYPQENIGTKKKPYMIYRSHSFYNCRCNGTEEILTKVGEELLDFIRKHGKFADADHGHSFRGTE